MIIVHEIELDLQNPGQMPRIQVKQGDVLSRQVDIRLFAGGEPWQIPKVDSAVIRYHGPSGEGLYDTLPNGAAAWKIEENTLSVFLAPQMLTCHGAVRADVVLIDGDFVLATGSFEIYVNLSATTGTQPGDQNYYRVATLDQINEKFLVTDEWIELVEEKKLNRSGDTMTGDLHMSQSRITGVAMPEYDFDVANRTYVDHTVGDAVRELAWGIPDEFTKLINSLYETVEMNITDINGNTQVRKVLVVK